MVDVMSLIEKRDLWTGSGGSVVKIRTEAVTSQTWGWWERAVGRTGGGREGRCRDPGLLENLAGLNSALGTPCMAVVIPAALRAAYYFLYVTVGEGEAPGG